MKIEEAPAATDSPQLTDLLLKAMAQYKSSFPGATVLDYGCGDGALSRAAAKLGAARVFGVDVDEARLEAARAHPETNGQCEMYLKGDSPRQALPPGTKADIVLCNPSQLPASLVDCKADDYPEQGADGRAMTDRLVEELDSVLAPGGFLLLVQSCLINKKKTVELLLDQELQVQLLAFEHIEAPPATLRLPDWRERLASLSHLKDRDTVLSTSDDSFTYRAQCLHVARPGDAPRQPAQPAQQQQQQKPPAYRPNASTLVLVIGGMGPSAGLRLHESLETLPSTARDQDHVSVLHASFPARLLDRTTFLLSAAGGGGASRKENPGLVVHREILEPLAAAFPERRIIVVAASGAFHAKPIFDPFVAGATMLNAARPSAYPIAVVDMVSATAGALQQLMLQKAPAERDPAAPKLVFEVLATCSPVEDAYVAAAARIGDKALFTVKAPPAEDMQTVRNCVFDPQQGLKARSGSVVADVVVKALAQALRRCVERGVAGVILGCTELERVASAPGIAGTFTSITIIMPSRAAALTALELAAVRQQR